MKFNLNKIKFTLEVNGASGREKCAAIAARVSS